jgi:sulfide dehydrogenase cytochrome subunit
MNHKEKLMRSLITPKLAPMLATTLMVALVAGPARAVDTGARLYATCAGCHGTNGAGTGGALPVLAGQPQEALAAALRAFKAGSRPATIMQQIAKGYSDEQIVLLAAFLAAQQP